MGASKRKRAFLAQHTVCYLCGVRRATTVDHVPSRECFRDRIGPEGFEFPACEPCNRLDSQIEQAFAAYVRMFDFDTRNFSANQMIKLSKGVTNNTPELLPNILRAVEKRRAINKGHLRMGYLPSVHSAPIVGFPPEGHTAIKRFARKLACALFYKHAGRPVTLRHRIITNHYFYSEKRLEEILITFNNFLPDYVNTSRINTNIGEQFCYRYGFDEREFDIFGFISQFSKSVFIAGGVTSAARELDDAWIVHSTDFPSEALPVET